MEEDFIGAWLLNLLLPAYPDLRVPARKVLAIFVRRTFIGSNIQLG